MDITLYILFTLVGILSGFFGGLLGIGGGLIAVPALLAIFHLKAFPLEHAMQVAIGTSLAAMVFTSFSSAGAHIWRKGVSWPYFRALAPGIVLGAVLGAWIADQVPSRYLAFFFGVIVFVLGLHFFFFSKEKLILRDLPNWLLGPLGVGIGALSSLMGIGGGILTVPILKAFHLPLHPAISTSAATGCLIAVVGALAFLGFGYNESPLQGTVGFIYMPAFICIGLSAFVAAPFGAKVAYALPVELLSKIFGVVLVVEGLVMMFA